VRDAGGAVVASLSISGPTLRLAERLLDEHGRLTRREADTVSALLGYDDREKGAA
jgi:DNA-binding IclR family transcriptional regulator